MSVNPGFGGQSFIHSSLEKIAAVRSLIDQSGKSIRLEVDGGINKDTIAAAAQLVLILLWQVRQFLIVKIMQRPFPNFVKRLLSSLSIFWLLTPILAAEKIDLNQYLDRIEIADNNFTRQQGL